MAAVPSYFRYDGSFCQHEMYQPPSDPPSRPNKRLKQDPDSDSDSVHQFKFEFRLHRISRLKTISLYGTTFHCDMERYTVARSFTENHPKDYFKCQVSTRQIVYNMLSEMALKFSTTRPENYPLVRAISSYASKILNYDTSHDQISTMFIEITIVDKYLYDERETLEAHTMESIAENEQEEAYGFVPADDNVINKLERVKFDGPDSITRSCTVCLQDFNTGSTVTRMPCGHCFHGRCITPWLKTNHVCPNCRFELPKSGTS